MKQRIVQWLRSCQLLMMLLLTGAPIVLMQMSVHAPDSLSVSWVFLAACLLLGAVCLAVPGRKRIPTAAVSCGMLLVLGFVLLPLPDRPLLLLLPLSAAALLLLALPFAARRYESDVPPAFYVVGIAVQIVTQFLVHHLGQSGGSPYDPIAPALTVLCVSYMFLLLLSMNRISLDNASLARHRIPTSMRRLNTVLTLSFMALSLLLAVMPAVIKGVRALWQALVSALTRLSAFLLSLLPSVPDYGSSTAGGMMGLAELDAAETEPSAFALFLEKIASVVSLIVLVVGAAFLLRLIYVLLRRLARHLVRRLRLYMSAASAEYDDEITDTREDGAQREIRFLRRDRRRTSPQANTPTARIRQTYARLLRRNPKWAASSTARENLPEEAAALYERARYSEHPVTSEDAERFANEVRKA